MESILTRDEHVDNDDKIKQKQGSPISINKIRDSIRQSTPFKPIATSTKRSMAYITIKGIESETSYLEHQWPLFAVKEFPDNSYDWLNDYYPMETVENREIALRIWTTEKEHRRLIKIAVRNSNANNIPAFEDLDDILDFTKWQSTKRYQHRMTTGSLGDAMKRVLGMGFASWTSNYNPEDSFEDKQWDELLIVRYNGCERTAKIIVDLDNQTYHTDISKPVFIGDKRDTEVEVTLPIVEEQYSSDNIFDKIRRYFKAYKIAKSNISWGLTINHEVLD